MPWVANKKNTLWGKVYEDGERLPETVSLPILNCLKGRGLVRFEEDCKRSSDPVVRELQNKIIGKVDIAKFTGKASKGKVEKSA